MQSPLCTSHRISPLSLLGWLFILADAFCDFLVKRRVLGPDYGLHGFFLHPNQSCKPTGQSGRGGGQLQANIRGPVGELMAREEVELGQGKPKQSASELSAASVADSPPRLQKTGFDRIVAQTSKAPIISPGN